MVWDDTKIRVGQKWKAEITAALERAKVAVLLVSRHFLASDFINSREVPALLDSAEQHGLSIVWIAIGYSLYEHTDITEFQAANDPAKPLNSLSEFEADRELVRIARALDFLITQSDAAADRAPAHLPEQHLRETENIQPSGAMDQLRDEPDSRSTPNIEVEDAVNRILEAVGRKDVSAERSLESPATSQSSIIERLRSQMRFGPWAWRSVHALSARAGVDESTALDILRADPQVELSRSKAGRFIARLRRGLT